MVAVKELELAGRIRLALFKPFNVVIISHNLNSDDGDKSFTGIELVKTIVHAANTGCNRALVGQVSLFLYTI